MRVRAVLILPLLAALSACGAPDYYLLPPEAAVTQARSGRVSLAVSDLDLPAYAGALEIAAVSQGGAVQLERNALWADTPQRALTRHLVSALQRRLGGQVMADPWPAFDPPALQLRVVVDRMIGGPGTTLDFAGQYVLVSSSSGGIVASDRFAIQVPTETPGYGGLLAAHARAVEILADQVAARIAGRTGA